MIRGVGILLFAAVLPALASLVIHRGSLARAIAPVVGISYREAFLGNVIWVDARSADEYRRDHVAGAISLGTEGWDQALAEIARRWKPGVRIVVYCSAGCDLAREAAVRLRTDAGIEGVFTLEGGWPPGAAGDGR